MKPPAPLMPYLRTMKLAMLRARAERAARRPGPDPSSEPPPGFIVGCGRSGTTILGKVFMTHPQVRYLFEPYHLWASIDRRTDVTNLHYPADGLFIMRGEHASPGARDRFARLVLGARGDRRIVVEKTPHNIARIGFLEALSPPGARYVHIVRSGLDAARSIDRLATVSGYKMAGKPRYNQWWGVDHRKWSALARDGAAAGYFPDEVPRLRTHAQRGAYEWLVSLGEAERWRPVLGPRLCEITYADLTSDPRGTLARLCAFLGVDGEETWLAAAAGMVEAERKNRGEPLRLPPGMRERFNAWMTRYAFEGRAEALDGDGA